MAEYLIRTKIYSPDAQIPYEKFHVGDDGLIITERKDNGILSLKIKKM